MLSAELKKPNSKLVVVVNGLLPNYSSRVLVPCNCVIVQLNDHNPSQQTVVGKVRGDQQREFDGESQKRGEGREQTACQVARVLRSTLDVATSTTQT